MIIQSANDPVKTVQAGVRSTTLVMGPHPYRDLGCPHCRHDDPQAFIVEAGPDDVIPTHFHPVDQFQLFLSGWGSVGQHGLGFATVHYADRNSPYGPLRAGGAGFRYMTLRRRSDGGADWMPESRELLRDQLAAETRDVAGRRHHTVDGLALVGAGQPGEWVMAVDEPDGLRIAIVRANAGDVVEPLSRAGAGGFVVVLEGALTGEANELAAGSVVFTEPGDPRLALTATRETALVADLQFPDEDVAVG
jgi:quercetin dioxygenase-like cupin family protein